jgi:hypothetical protein
MKHFFILILLSLIFVSPVSAETRTLKTYTPFTPQQFYNYNHRGHKFLPPPPPPNYYNNYNGFVSPYYYNNVPKRSVLEKVSDFFSTGQMTGYTNSNDLIPDEYGYQNQSYDDFGNYKYNNYGQQHNATIKLLD